MSITINQARKMPSTSAMMAMLRLVASYVAAKISRMTYRSTRIGMTSPDWPRYDRTISERPTTTSYAVLGSLSLSPMSDYDLHQAASRSIAYFWPVSKPRRREQDLRRRAAEHAPELQLGDRDSHRRRYP